MFCGDNIAASKHVRWKKAVGAHSKTIILHTKKLNRIEKKGKQGGKKQQDAPGRLYL